MRSSREYVCNVRKKEKKWDDIYFQKKEKAKIYIFYIFKGLNVYEGISWYYFARGGNVCVYSDMCFHLLHFIPLFFCASHLKEYNQAPWYRINGFQIVTRFEYLFFDTKLILFKGKFILSYFSQFSSVCLESSRGKLNSTTAGSRWHFFFFFAQKNIKQVN